MVGVHGSQFGVQSSGFGVRGFTVRGFSAGPATENRQLSTDNRQLTNLMFMFHSSYNLRKSKTLNPEPKSGSCRFHHYFRIKPKNIIIIFVLIRKKPYI
jgi:hypothetical protein